jgi:3-hydroxyisobutyrate dehydrogenase-like beta-hydroxyacid dehydrogenase
MKIGFIGLGHMGSAMAKHLLGAGHELAVYNRSAEKAAELARSGAQPMATAGAAAAGAEVVVTMLANDDAVERTVLGPGGVLAELPRGAIHISSSTISVALSERLARAHAEAGQRYVAAPAFGRPAAAAAKQLFFVACGEPDAVAACAPLFEAMGQRTFVLSERPAAANLVKLSGNFLIAAVIESLGEAIALVERGGVDPHGYLDLLTSTLFGAPIYKTYGSLIVDRAFEPAGFAASLGAKDIRLVLAAGEALGVPLPLASLVRDRFVRLAAHGKSQLDWSAIGRLPSDDAGL